MVKLINANFWRVSSRCLENSRAYVLRHLAVRVFIISLWHYGSLTSIIHDLLSEEVFSTQSYQSRDDLVGIVAWLLTSPPGNRSLIPQKTRDFFLFPEAFTPTLGSTQASNFVGTLGVECCFPV